MDDGARLLRRSRLRGLLVRCVLGVAFLLMAPPGAAQPVRRLETSFERDVNRFRWISEARVEARLAGWDVALANRFLSDAFILFEDQLRFRDEDHFTWQARRPLGGSTALHLHGRTAWFGLSRVLSQESFAGLRLAPRPYAWIEPMLGAAWDRRPGAVGPEGTAPLRSDAGPAAGLRTSLAPPPLQDYRLRLDAEGTWQRLSPRQGRTLRLDAAAERTFEATRLASALRLVSVRRDIYRAVSFLNRDAAGRSPESVEATTSDTAEVSLQLDAPFYRAIRLTARLDAGLNSRFIRTAQAPDEALFFETDFNRRALDTEAALLYEHDRLTARLAFRAGAAAERRSLANRDALPPAEAAQKAGLLRQADYDEGTLALSGFARMPLGPRLVLRATAASRIVRHDTPEANPDDRDEVFHNAELALRLRLSRYLDADVSVFGSFYHTVYLEAARSAENNIQRTLRLRPALRYTPTRRTQATLGAELRATYTVDDFVLPGRRPTDQSARALRFEGSLEQDLGGGVRLRASGSYEDLRLGRLLWEDFAEIPFDTLRTYNAWVRVQAGRRLVSEVGLRLFVRTDYERTATVRYERHDAAGAVVRDAEGQPILDTITRPGRQWIEQLGPTAALTWPMGRGSALRLDGWVNAQHVYRRLYGLLPPDDAPLIRRSARRGTRTLIPNLALTVVWNF